MLVQGSKRKLKVLFIEIDRENCCILCKNYQYNVRQKCNREGEIKEFLPSASFIAKAG